MKVSDNILAHTFKEVGIHLTPKEKKSFFFQVAISVSASFIEVIGLATLIPLIVIIQNPALIHSNSFLSSMYAGMGFQVEGTFILFLILMVLLTFLFKNLLSLYIINLQSKFAFVTVLEMTKRQYWKYMSQPYQFFLEKGIVGIEHNIFHLPGYFAWGILIPLITLCAEAAVIFVIFLSIFIYNPLLLLSVGMVLIPGAAILYLSTKNKLFNVGLKRDQYHKQSFEILNRALSGYIDVKLASREQFFLDKFYNGFVSLQKQQKTLHVIHSIPTKSFEVLTIVGILVIFLYTQFLTSNPERLFEFLGLFATAAFRVMPSLNKILLAFMSLRTHQYTFEYLKEIRGEYGPENSPAIKIPFQKEIEFRNISFRYPNSTDDALSEFSFTIKKGEKVGIIGESGSGKTTLMNLLLRFVTEGKGDILVDGHKLTAADTRGWRSQIGYVKQDVFLVDDSIRNNIAFGEDEKNIRHEDVKTSATKASLDKLLASLPKGLDTLVGEGGAKLSGGQKQRVGIARALYRNSEILIFDEATSALDMETEKEVTEAIDNLSERAQTVFIIAHRITTLKGCDRIIELKDGKITGYFSYEQLLKDKLHIS